MDIVNISKDSGISQTVLGEIVRLAEKYEIKELFLFGSRTRGDYSRTSDIDLAVSGIKVMYGRKLAVRTRSINLTVEMKV